MYSNHRTTLNLCQPYTGAREAGLSCRRTKADRRSRPRLGARPVLFGILRMLSIMIQWLNVAGSSSLSMSLKGENHKSTQVCEAKKSVLRAFSHVREVFARPMFSQRSQLRHARCGSLAAAFCGILVACHRRGTRRHSLLERKHPLSRSRINARMSG